MTHSRVRSLGFDLKRATVYKGKKGTCFEPGMMSRTTYEVTLLPAYTGGYLSGVLCARTCRRYLRAMCNEPLFRESIGQFQATMFSLENIPLTHICILDRWAEAVFSDFARA